MSEAGLRELQRQRLLEVFPHICSTPFYRVKLPGITAQPQKSDPFAYLAEMPFTYKDELRSTSPMARTPLDLSDLVAFFSSSGTTGEPSVYAWSKVDQQVYEEVSGRLLRNIGVGPGDVVLLPLRMGMQFPWFGILSEMRGVGAAVVPLGAASFAEIARALAYYPITILKTSPVMASRLFRFIAETDASLLSSIHLRQVHLAGFYSSNARRRRLSGQWGADCYDMYGLSEFGLVGGECDAKSGQHFCADYILAEVLDPHSRQPVAPGQTGVAVYTSLWQKASPLLRYWSNDYISLNDSPCTCGVGLPRLAFRGRDLDSAVLDGRRVFASDVEEILLSFEGIGDEYLVEIRGTRDRCRCTIVAEGVGHVPVPALEEQLGELLLNPLELRLVPPHTLDRESAKPLRILDHRE